MDDRRGAVLGVEEVGRQVDWQDGLHAVEGEPLAEFIADDEDHGSGILGGIVMDLSLQDGITDSDLIGRGSDTGEWGPWSGFGSAARCNLVLDMIDHIHPLCNIVVGGNRHLGDTQSGNGRKAAPR